MTERSNDNRGRKNLDSIRDVLARLEVMANANQTVAEQDQTPAGSAPTPEKTARKDGTAVVTSIAGPRRADVNLASYSGNNSGINATSISPSARDRVVPLEPNGLAKAKDIWQRSPFELETQRTNSNGAHKSPRSADLALQPAKFNYSPFIGFGVLIALGCGLAIGNYVRWNAETTSTSAALAMAAKDPIVASLAIANAGVGVPVPPVPVPARRPATGLAPSGEGAGIYFAPALDVVSGVTVAVGLRIDPVRLQGVNDYYVTLSGLPAGASLSQGRMVYPGVWAIEPAELAELRLTMPLHAPPATTVSLMLVARPGRVIAEGRGTIAMRGSDTVPAAASTATDDPGHSQERMRRSLALLAEGKADTARALFQEEAEHGDADAALFLGMTFDPRFTRQLGAGQLAPDVDLARQWYRMAAANGSAEAADHLKQLEPK